MMKFSTLAIHKGQSPDPETGAVIPPIYQTTTYAQDVPGELKAGYDYARAGNPTRTALEEVLAGLEGGERGFAFASGMGAITTLVMALLQSGDHIILGDDSYGGTFRLIDKVMKRFGITASFIDMTDLANVRAAITPETKMIFLETPTNPTLRLFDIQAIMDIAQDSDLIGVVDNTFASPYLQQPLSLGADIVVHSTTKYINGHSDVVGGALIVKDGTYAEDIFMHQMSIGATPDPLASWLTLRGLKTLAVRMDRHVSNAIKVAEFLEVHDQVEEIMYPGLKSHPQYALGRTQMKAPGGMISIRINGDQEQIQSFLSALKYFVLAESLGGVESLIEIPAIMTHASLPPEERAKLGITDNLIRISIGIEDAEDLISDLDNAFKTAFLGVRAQEKVA